MALIDDYLDVRPDAHARLSRLVDDDRLSIGPWYVLADELLAGGEPLLRNLLMGRRRAAALGGWLPVGYSPDAFGHPATLPSLLRGFGISTALLWRGAEPEPGRDRDLFRWTAPDGASVLVHHLPPEGYEYGAELPATVEALRPRWTALRAVLERRAVTSVLLVLNGADHHALQPDLPAAVAALRSLEPDAEVRIGTLADYFAAIRSAGGDQPTAPDRRGELRHSPRHTWALQGVHATRAGLKRRIAEGAALLTRWAEPQAALAALAGGRDRRALLEAAWRAHLLNLSHDVLAGCVADAVAADAARRADQVIEQARGLLDDALHERLGQDRVRARRAPEQWQPALVLVNPSPHPRAGIVETTVTVFGSHVSVGRPPKPGPARAGRVAFHLRDASGRVVPHQALGAWEAYERLDSARAYPDQDRVWATRVALLAPQVPAFGVLRLDLADRAAGGAISDPVRATARALHAPWGRVVPSAGGFAVQRGSAVLEGVGGLESERDAGDTYTFEAVPGDSAARAQWGAPRVVWRGPLVAALARPFRIGRRVRGTLFLRIDARSDLVRLTVEGENLQGDHRCRMVLPAGHAGAVTADMPFGPVTRTPRRHGPQVGDRERPPPTAPMHRYVAAPRWTLYARGQHEYECRPGGDVAVTLFRAVGELSRDTLRARPGHAGWPTATPEAQAIGPFRVELALAPRGADETSPGADWEAVERAAETFHAPVIGRMLRYGIAVPQAEAGPELSGEGLVFSALKPRDDGEGVVLRCVNVTRQRVAGTWRWPTAITRALRARLDETVLAELKLGRDRRTIRFTAGPREIVTVVVEV